MFYVFGPDIVLDGLDMKGNEAKKTSYSLKPSPNLLDEIGSVLTKSLDEKLKVSQSQAKS